MKHFFYILESIRVACKAWQDSVFVDTYRHNLESIVHFPYSLFLIRLSNNKVFQRCSSKCTDKNILIKARIRSPDIPNMRVLTSTRERTSFKSFFLLLVQVSFAFIRSKRTSQQGRLASRDRSASFRPSSAWRR